MISCKLGLFSEKMLGIITTVLNSPLTLSFLTSMGIQWVGWAVASFFHTEKFYDLVGSLTFMLISHLSHGQSKMTM